MKRSFHNRSKLGSLTPVASIAAHTWYFQSANADWSARGQSPMVMLEWLIRSCHEIVSQKANSPQPLGSFPKSQASSSLTSSGASLG